jgi:hypothetical protein
MKKKQKPFLHSIVLNKNKKHKISKAKLEWGILIILVLSMVVAQVSGLYPYAYNYAKCDGAPLEVRGSYYRIPDDDIYGIHIGSDYSRCFDRTPEDLQRDPSTKIGAAIIRNKADNEARLKRLAAEYDIYIPNGYKVSDIHTLEQSDGLVTRFSVTTSTNNKFSVREMKKDDDFSYTNLCSRPASENWSGTIIGKDSKGREICKVNPSKYVKDYIVGINIGKTAIMLQAPNISEELLNAEATAIFSSMEPSSN